MAIAGIPEVIRDFNLYLTGNRLGGTTGEVAIPDFESTTATTSGNGILGEYEAIVVGHYGSMELEIPFRCICEDYFAGINPSSAVELMLRGSIQYTVKAKKIAIGTVKQREGMDSSITLELTYIMIEMDRQKRLELDKLNGVFKVNNVDMLSKTRQLT